MSNSILETIKKLIGAPEESSPFDPDIIVYINTILIILIQMGIGPQNGFSITSEAETWKDFLGDKLPMLEHVKTYVALRVRLLFDPPMSSAVTEVLKEQIKELEYRIYITANPNTTFKNDSEDEFDS